MEKETAIKILKELHDKSLLSERTALEALIPELRESEDEKIRKALLSEFINLQSKGYKFAGLEGEAIVSWLESKGEQKPAWSEEDEVNLSRAIWYVENPALSTVKDTMLVEWLKSLKDRYTWKPSDEQMITLRHVISGYSYDIEPLVELETKLKEL